jgi:general secretion pathway protein D
MSTTVKVTNGQTIIIGGLIEKLESVQDDQVPFLGNIPLMGYFFKSRNKQDAKNELVVLIQPFLVGK